MHILITGSKGFIAGHLIPKLPNCKLLEFGRGDSIDKLRSDLALADIIFHLAGVNRPDSASEYDEVNVGLTKEICSILDKLGRKPKIIFASSIQADLDNLYGISKKKAEDILFDFAKKSNATVRIYRLKNVFGPGCKPNYNSVVSTFCYNTANNLAIHISDPGNKIELVYIDDVIEAFVLDIHNSENRVITSVKISIAELAKRIISFHNMHLVSKEKLDQQLYKTYLSYVSYVSERK